MRLIGYARVATVHQNLARQLGALRAARCKTIFQEKASGKDVRGRPELERAIDELGAGDVLVLAEWDRATRSMMDGIAIMERVRARGAAIKAVDLATNRCLRDGAGEGLARRGAVAGIDVVTESRNP